MNYAEQLEWMYSFITQPGFDRELEQQKAEEILATVRGDEKFTAAERARVYREQYRLKGGAGLANDFPHLTRFLGRDRLNHLALEYLVAQPSTCFNITRLRDNFPAFLKQYQGLENQGFVVDLATLEQNLGVVGDAPEVKPVAPDAMPPPERWARTIFVPVPALVLQAFRYNIHGWLLDANVKPEPWKTPLDNWLVIYRRDYDVWRLPLDRRAYYLLRLLTTRTPLGSALAMAAGNNQPLQMQLVEGLKGCLQQGMFAAFTFTDAPRP
ncbi:MAG: HvfC/BufC family peptide modification chaperone [Candidatus Xenobia bacterium]